MREAQRPQSVAQTTCVASACGRYQGAAWKGWRLHGDTLYSPEGHGFGARDHAWWSLLVRRAAMFGELRAQCEAARAESERLRALTDRSEEHTSELQSLMRISYAVFCLKKKNIP